MQDCIFCKIIGGELPAKVVYEDEFAIGFHDIQPAAPQHYVVVPRMHVRSLADLTPTRAKESGLDAAQFVGDYYNSILRMIEKLDLHSQGFRLVTNTGENGGQTVFHLHSHVLAGKKMSPQMS